MSLAVNQIEDYCYVVLEASTVNFFMGSSNKC